LNRPFHADTPEAVAQQLGCPAEGLSAAEVLSRRAMHGTNRLPEPPRPSALLRFAQQFNNVLIIVLLAAALITALLQHWLDTIVILAVVVVNTVLGFVQEGKAERAIAAIRGMLAPRATVLRDGQRQQIAAEELVPGDLVILEAGDRVPADLRLLSVSALATQEALLTGESLPVEKNTTAVSAQAPLGDRLCMAYSGTLVTTGQARGVVVAIGAATELGRISHLLTNVEQLSTPLLQQMAQFSKWLTGFILVLAAAILAWGYLVRGMPFDELFVLVVGLSVASIPEGLPAVLTVTLAIGVQAMARRNAIVRRLPAIETLGSVSVICTDKTGTLTRNEMMVSTLGFSDALYQVTGDGYGESGEILANAEAPAGDQRIDMLARAALLCNDAVLKLEDGHWQVLGDPMEGALLRLAGKAGLVAAQETAAAPRRAQIPFDARHRYMATLHDAGSALVYLKGAPERVLGMCHLQLNADGSASALDVALWEALADQIAAGGQRVLAFAMTTGRQPQIAQLEHADVASGMTLLGLTGLIDPPRAEAIQAIQECYSAGIDVKMITGDHAGTAAAIGRQIGLQRAEQVLTGHQIDDMDDQALSAAVLTTDIFARTSPEHKLRLVTALQAQGKVVAMTGDGVNDAPALKRADAGIAMGHKGSEAAKEASELVLLDDNFASIVAAVREGRTVYDNLRKVISFLLPINGGESLSLIIAILFALTLPITAAQILWVNMVSSVALALALAFEPSEPGVMKRKPRSMNEPILSGSLIWRIVLISTLFTIGVFGQFVLTQIQGLSLELSRTMTVNTLVAMEVFYMFSVRYSHSSALTWRGVLGTPVVLMSVGAVLALQLVFTYTPWMWLAFGTSPLTVQQGLQVLMFGVAVLLIIELEKWLRRRLQPASRT
jgi:magnesium-transporting ATPase (P-type)